MKIRPMGAELLHADVRMDRRDEANSLCAILRTRLKIIAVLRHIKIAEIHCVYVCVCGGGGSFETLNVVIYDVITGF